MEVFLGLVIPFVGTSLGSALVFFMHNQINKKFEHILLGFASGVMMAASVWSLLLPAIQLASTQGHIAWLPPAIGFIIGIFFLLFLERFLAKLDLNNKKLNNSHSFKKTMMLVLSVTLHNIPEGMAVGVVFAGLISGNTAITLAGAISLSIGIAIQNFPEGAIISMPLKSEGIKKPQAFIYGVLSGIVEPISALLTILLTSFIVPILPYLLSFAAGAMIYVVVGELIPESQKSTGATLGTIGVAIGFVIMMILDVALG